jgi:TatA/E family protein of Tat protein translocase
MFNLGPFELVAIFVVALLVFGPEKLPEMGKQVGKAIREFRKFQESMQGQVRDVLEPISGPIIPNGNVVGPQPTNIKGVIPTELPEGQQPEGQQNVNVPRSATIQDPGPPEGEEAAPKGSFGYYAPVETPPAETETASPAPGGASQAGETPPSSNPADPESR